MLLDPQNDPHELHNLAGDPQHAGMEGELSARIRAYAGGLTESAER